MNVAFGFYSLQVFVEVTEPSVSAGPQPEKFSNRGIILKDVLESNFKLLALYHADSKIAVCVAWFTYFFIVALLGLLAPKST